VTEGVYHVEIYDKILFGRFSN